MTFTQIFGGATLYPAGQTYLGLTFATDQQLQWPIEQAISGNVVASIMDLNATAAGLNVDIPDARQVSNGVQSVFNNTGANTITIRDAAGGTILSIVSGSAWVAYLTDNSTLAGTWRIFQLGASVSVAVASALAGAGLKAIGSTLDQRIAPTSTAVTPITWTDSDRAQLTIWTGGLGVLDLPSPGVVGSDWFSMIRNSGSGDLTITPPAGTIDGGASLTLSPNSSATVVTDGANFFTVGLGQSTASFFDFLEINVAGSGDYVLSGVELNRVSYRFIGALTGSRNIIVPSSVQQYWVDNSTSGAFSLFVKTVPQVTPVEVIQGGRNILYCDGPNVVNAESNTISFPVSIAQGGTGAADAATALSNLGGVAGTIDLIAGVGLSGGGDLSGPDRTFQTDDPAIDHDNLLNFVTDEHVAHSGVIITAGAGMTGGGGIDVSRTLDIIAAADAALVINANNLRVDIPSLTADTPNQTNELLFDQAGVNKRATFASLIENAGVQIGSFTPTWLGFSSPPVGDIDYYKIPGFGVWLRTPIALNGTSNSISMSISGIPVTIRPTASVIVQSIVLDNGVSSPNFGTANLNVIGDISFGNGPQANGGFTASGIKGLTQLWTLFYPNGF